MMRVVCAGEVMIELAPLDRAAEYKRSFAGDTFNTAWYLAGVRPEWSVEYLTAVGRDTLSDDFCAFAQTSGIGTGLIARHDTRTLGLYLIELKDAERSFFYWRDQSAARTLADDPSALAAHLQGADLIFFSGITLAILDDAGRARFLSAVGHARSTGARVAFDPNLRLRLWSDVAAMRSAITDAAHLADLILPSFDEEAEIFGDASPEATIARYRAGGAACVVVKNGGGPVRFSCDGQGGCVLPKATDAIVDTTAAGDSFNARFLASYLTGERAEDAVEAACTLSRHVIGQRGALVAVPDAEFV